MNLSDEIMDALTDFYNNDEDIISDCVMWLNRNCKNFHSSWIENNNRCERCGMKLEEYNYKEYYSEIDGTPIEEISELLCPNCDMITEEYL